MNLLEIDIETDDRSLSSQFMGMPKETVVFTAGAAPVVFRGFLVRKSADVLSDALKFVVDASINIDLALLGAWLYDKVKNRPATQMRIRRKIVTELTEEGIKQVLKEEITLLK